MTPTSRLAAPVTGSASAPICWISRGSAPQSTEPGRDGFGTAAAQRPVKLRVSFNLAGSCAATAPIRTADCSADGTVGWLPALPVQRDQARRLRVLLLDHAGALTIRIQPIEKPCERSGARAVNAIDIRQVDVDEATSVEPSWNILHGPGHRRRMGQVERTGRHETRPVSFPVCSDGDWHGQILFQLERPDGQRLFMRRSAYKLDLGPTSSPSPRLKSQRRRLSVNSAPGELVVEEHNHERDDVQAPRHQRCRSSSWARPIARRSHPNPATGANAYSHSAERQQQAMTQQREAGVWCKHQS